MSNLYNLPLVVSYPLPPSFPNLFFKWGRIYWRSSSQHHHLRTTFFFKPNVLYMRHYHKFGTWSLNIGTPDSNLLLSKLIVFFLVEIFLFTNNILIKWYANCLIISSIMNYFVIISADYSFRVYILSHLTFLNPFNQKVKWKHFSFSTNKNLKLTLHLSGQNKIIILTSILGCLHWNLEIT